MKLHRARDTADGRRIGASRSVLSELDRVTVTVAVDGDDGVSIPPGSEGTVVAVWGNRSDHEVEFTAPRPGLATVRATNVQAVQPSA